MALEINNRNLKRVLKIITVLKYLEEVLGEERNVNFEKVSLQDMNQQSLKSRFQIRLNYVV